MVKKYLVKFIHLALPAATIGGFQLYLTPENGKSIRATSVSIE